jgi:two-component system, NarL family, response regulator DevR
MRSGDSRRALPARDSRRGCKGGTQTRVLVVDDYAVVRAGLRAILEAEEGIQVVGEADTASAAMRLSARTRPDVAVMAVLPGRRIEAQAINEIRAKSPDTQVLVLTAPGDDEALFASIRSGAAGYLPANVSCGDLVRAVRAVGAGHTLLDPAMTGPVIEQVRRSRRQPLDDKLARLSVDEQRVLALLTQGRTNREIAEQLGQALATVKKRVSAILVKLEVGRRAEAAAYLAQRQVRRNHAPGT